MRTKIVVSILIIIILVRFLYLAAQSYPSQGFQDQISKIHKRYGMDESVNTSLSQVIVPSTNTYRYDDYCVFLSNSPVKPCYILNTFLQDSSINYIVWTPLEYMTICCQYKFVENSRDTFITLLEHNKCYSEDFIMVQRSQFSFDLLYQLCLPRYSMNRLFDTELGVKPSKEKHENVQYSYFFTIYMNGTLSIEMKNEPYHLKNRIKHRSTYPTIFQTWVSHGTDNDRIWHCYQKIEELYKDHNYILFSDFEMKKFIRNEYDETVCHQYDNIVPTAFKSDFFRYLYMWKNGGVYLDISVEPLENVFDYFRKHYDKTNYRFISSMDNGLRNGLWNGMMFAVPNSPVMYSCISQIMNMTKSKIRACLDYTGPSVLGRALRESGLSMNEVYLFEFKDSKYIRDPKTGIVLFEPKNSKGEGSRLTKILYKQSTKSHYSVHCIYNQVFLYDS